MVSTWSVAPHRCELARRSRSQEIEQLVRKTWFSACYETCLGAFAAAAARHNSEAAAKATSGRLSRCRANPTRSQCSPVGTHVENATPMKLVNLLLALLVIGCGTDTSSVSSISRTCAPGAAGVPSPQGGCCSEWIPCASDLTCAPLGEVHPGSQGVCSSKQGASCSPGSAGVPSPEGGCCSEWISCAGSLTCEPDGPVFPGSLGICLNAP